MGLRQSIGMRLVIVVLITFFLLLPSFMIRALVSERQQRRDSVASEVSQSWGAEQKVVGPILHVPYKYWITDDGKKTHEYIDYAHFLPERLAIGGSIEPQIRNRGIYDVVLYNASLELTGEFAQPRFEDLKVPESEIMWQDAFVTIAISDMKGVRDQINFAWNNEARSANPGMPTQDVGSSGVSVPVKISAGQSTHAFQSKLNLNGSSNLKFAPIGRETTVQLSSTWTNPGFTGEYLPTSRDLTENGFQSEWRIMDISRDFPQLWIGSRYSVYESLFGVGLLLPVDQYQETTRTVKYAIMFIGLTFLTFFVMEILGGTAIHPMQYLLIGLALLVFYTLLLSISEYVSFGYAYLIASVAIIAMITLYSISVLADKRRSAMIALVLSVLYGYLYIVLQLQDYALLMGSLVLFAALGFVMYLTRKIDWFTVLSTSESGH